MPYSADQLTKAAMADKKNAGDKLRIIVPEKIGRCVIKTITLAELESWI